MSGRFDIYKGLWFFLFGVDSASSPTTQNPLVVNSDGSINTNSTPSGVVKSGTATDKSFTTDGASHIVIAANASRLGYMIENPVSSGLNPNADPIYINLGAAAATSGNSFEVPAGQTFPPPWLVSYTGDIYVLGVSGIKCPAKEFTA